MAEKTPEETAMKVLLTEMTWPEVKEALKRNPVVIIPVGSIEQHGRHLPLGSDHFGALRTAIDAARRTAAIVAPATYVGVSAHHLGFPGTMTLSPDTLVQVLFEVGTSLASHGFHRIILLNAHGGNETACKYAAEKITKHTTATAIVLGIDDLVRTYPRETLDKLDIHAGQMETAEMLHLVPHLVNMAEARRPSLNLLPRLAGLLAKVKEDPTYFKIIMSSLPDTHELSDTGAISLLDPATGTTEQGRQAHENFVELMVEFIRKWDEAGTGI